MTTAVPMQMKFLAPSRLLRLLAHRRAFDQFFEEAVRSGEDGRSADQALTESRSRHEGCAD